MHRGALRSELDMVAPPRKVLLTALKPGQGRGSAIQFQLDWDAVLLDVGIHQCQDRGDVQGTFVEHHFANSESWPFQRIDGENSHVLRSDKVSDTKHAN